MSKLVGDSARVLRFVLLSSAATASSGIVFFACGSGNSDSPPGIDAGHDGGADVIAPPPPPTDAGQPEPSIRVVAGDGNTCIVADGGIVRCWGNNATGELGQQTWDNAPHPAPGLVVPGVTDVRIADHACGIGTGGDLRCWGYDQSGVTGQNPSQSSQCNSGAPCTLGPTPVPGMSGVQLFSVSVDFTCAQREAGVACWGYGIYGSTGPWDGGPRAWEPVALPLSGLSTLASSVSSSWTHSSCGRKAIDGTVWCWGSNTAGQLGRSSLADGGPVYPFDNHDHPIPEPVTGLRDTRDVAVGGAQVCAILSDNTVSCWGDNQFGQLGHDPESDIHVATDRLTNVPTPVSGLGPVRELALGFVYTCALKDDDLVYCWGFNDRGQLGHDPALDSDSSNGPYSFRPQAVVNLRNVAHISAYSGHTCAVTWNSEVWCWGQNYNEESGPLNDGGPYFHYMPARIEGF